MAHPHETNTSTGKTYGQRLTERLGQYPASVKIHPATLGPLRIPVREANIAPLLPFAVMVDGQPYDTLATLSVSKGTKFTGGGNPGQAETLVDRAPKGYAVIRKPYGDELSVLQLTPQHMREGSAVIDTTESAAPQTLEQGVPFTDIVPIDDQPESLTIQDVGRGELFIRMSDRFGANPAIVAAHNI